MNTAEILRERIRMPMGDKINPSIIKDDDLDDIEVELKQLLSRMIQKPIVTHKELKKELDKLEASSPEEFQKLIDWLLSLILKRKGIIKDIKRKTHKKERKEELIYR
jgi:hypothetical protein